MNELECDDQAHVQPLADGLPVAGGASSPQSPLIPSPFPREKRSAMPMGEKQPVSSRCRDAAFLAGIIVLALCGLCAVGFSTYAAVDMETRFGHLGTAQDVYVGSIILAREFASSGDRRWVNLENLMLMHLVQKVST